MFFDLPNLVALKLFILKKWQPKTTNFGKEGFTRTSEDYFSDVILGRLSIKIECTVLKSARWKVLGRVGLLSADIGLLIDGTNFVLALVLLQCSKRTSWLSGDSDRCISLARLRWSHKIADYCRGLRPGYWCRPNTVRCEVSGQTSFLTHAAE